MASYDPLRLRGCSAFLQRKPHYAARARKHPEALARPVLTLKVEGETRPAKPKISCGGNCESAHGPANVERPRRVREPAGGSHMPALLLSLTPIRAAADLTPLPWEVGCKLAWNRGRQCPDRACSNSKCKPTRGHQQPPATLPRAQCERLLQQSRHYQFFQPRRLGLSPRASAPTRASASRLPVRRLRPVSSSCSQPPRR